MVELLTTNLAVVVVVVELIVMTQKDIEWVNICGNLK
jgi:hypothetical protein